MGKDLFSDKKLKLPATETYAVGFAKPPLATRFKPGHSGNPKGRPRGRKSKLPGMAEERLKTLILQEAYRDVPIMELHCRSMSFMSLIVSSWACASTTHLHHRFSSNSSAVLHRKIISSVARQVPPEHGAGWMNTLRPYIEESADRIVAKLSSVTDSARLHNASELFSSFRQWLMPRR